MTVPSRRESAALLLSLDPPAWHLRHSRAVAETAAWLAQRAGRLGRVDRRLVEAAALLHDLDKLPAVKAHVRGHRHGEGTAEWLAQRGFAELGPLVTSHPVTRLADGEWFERWIVTASPEELIVSYADKRAGQRLEPMAQRFGHWQRRYPPRERTNSTGDPWTPETVAAVWRHARVVEVRVCELAGIAPHEVRRLAWTSRALEAARRPAVAEARS